MASMNIAASTRVCTEAETQALSLWSASYLPFCRIWAAKHGLQPPLRIIEILQHMRIDVPALSEAQLEPLLTSSAQNKQTEGHVEYASKLARIATDLSSDLQQMQEWTSQAHAYERGHFLTMARDLRRFQRGAQQLPLTELELAASELMLIPLFSVQRMTLYVPLWLIDVLPQTLFEPNSSFYRPRHVSLMWLLFDAIVITKTYEFKTI